MDPTTSSPYIYQVSLKDKEGNEIGLGATVTDHTSNQRQIVHSPVSSELYKRIIYRAMIDKNGTPMPVKYPRPVKILELEDSSVSLLFADSVRFSLEKVDSDLIEVIESCGKNAGKTTKLYIDTKLKYPKATALTVFCHKPKELTLEFAKEKIDAIASLIREQKLNRFDAPRYNRHGVTAIGVNTEKQEGFIFLATPDTGEIKKINSKYCPSMYNPEKNFIVKDEENSVILQNIEWAEHPDYPQREYYLNGEEAKCVDWPKMEDHKVIVTPVKTEGEPIRKTLRLK